MYKIQIQHLDYALSKENEWVQTDGFYNTIEEAFPIALFWFSCKNRGYNYYVKIVDINNNEVFWLTYRDIEIVNQIYGNYKDNVIDDVMRHISNKVKNNLIEKGIDKMTIVVNLNEFIMALEFAKQFTAGKKETRKYLQGIAIVFKNHQKICLQGSDSKILGSSKEINLYDSLLSEDIEILTKLIERIPLSAPVLFELLKFIKRLKKEKILKKSTLIEISLYTKNNKIVFNISEHMFQATYGDHYPDTKEIIQPSVPQKVVSDIPVDEIKNFLESIPIVKKTTAFVDIVLYDNLLIFKNIKEGACLFSKSPNDLDCLILKVDFTNQEGYNTKNLYCGRFDVMYLLKVLNPFNGLINWSFRNNNSFELGNLLITQKNEKSLITCTASVGLLKRLEFIMLFEGKDI